MGAFGRDGTGSNRSGRGTHARWARPDHRRNGVNGALASAELFGSTGSFSQVASMIHSRSQHVAVALEDGRVLVAGGKTQGDSVFSSAEVYDPNTNVWADAGLMNASRIGHTARCCAMAGAHRRWPGWGWPAWRFSIRGSKQFEALSVKYLFTQDKA